MKFIDRIAITTIVLLATACAIVLILIRKGML